MNKYADEIFKTIIEPFLRPRIKRGSIRAVRGYVTGVKFARLAALGLFGLGVYAALFVVGLFLAIFGLLGILPVSAEAVAVTALVVGLLLFAISSIGALIAFRQRRWLEMSKAYELMDAAISPWPSMMPPSPKTVFRGSGPKGELDFATRRVELEHALEKPIKPVYASTSPDVPLTIPPMA